MLTTFEGFAKKTERLCRLHSDKSVSEWLDNQDVCRLLNISPRILQTLRDNGTLSYSQICRKTYYKPEDVEKYFRQWKKNVTRPKKKENKYQTATDSSVTNQLITRENSKRIQSFLAGKHSNRAAISYSDIQILPNTGYGYDAVYDGNDYSFHGTPS